MPETSTGEDQVENDMNTDGIVVRSGQELTKNAREIDLCPGLIIAI